MAFIQTVPVDQATGDTRAMYERTQASVGYVPNYAKVFSHRPQVMAAWSALLTSIRGNLEPRQYELITLAAARAMQSSYCMLAHGTVLREKFYSAPRLTKIAADFAHADLTPADVAMMAFAERVARDAAAITDAEVRALREHGFSDAQVFDIAAAAAARSFFSKVVDALGALPDVAYAALEDDLKRELTPGRPISRETPERVPPA
ncbi:MAG: peroxidase-related enzyme [Candidatus Rokuibacteriota bacterium]